MHTSSWRSGMVATIASTLLLSIVSPVLGLPHDPQSQVKQEDFRERNFRTIQAIYNLTVYPNNMPIVQKGASMVPKGLFADNVLGRISPVGNFTGFADSIEYFFALAPVPDAVPTGIGIYAADISHFSSECPSVAASVVQLRTAKLDPVTGQIKPGSVKTPLKQVGFWRFNGKGEVTQYEAWIPNLELWTSYANGVDFSSSLVHAAVPLQLCPTIQERCTGLNQQFYNTATCIFQLERQPFGTFDQAWSNTNACRNIHIMLTLVRPDVHCPHVGLAGGSPPNNFKCVDAEYNNEYSDDKGLFGSDAPFRCPANT